MNIKLGQVVNSKEGLEMLSDIKVKAKIAFSIKKLIDVTSKEIESFEKVREDKIRQYGETRTNDEGKEVVEVSKENQESFLNEMNELFNETVNLEVPNISMDDFLNNETEITAKTLISLDWVFSTSEDENVD